MSLPEAPPGTPALSEIPAETLAAYVQDTPAADLLRQVNEHYYYWTELRRRPLPLGVETRVLWQVARQQRRQTARYFEWASGAERWRFSYNLPRSLQQLLYALDQQLGRANGLGLLEARRVGKAKLAYLRATYFEAVVARLRGTGR